MASTPTTIPLPLTLHVSQQTRELLDRQAAAHGTDLAHYVSSLVERNARRSFSLEAISGPVYQRFLDSGTTDDELAEELERAKHQLRAERRARQTP